MQASVCLVLLVCGLVLAVADDKLQGAVNTNMYDSGVAAEEAYYGHGQHDGQPGHRGKPGPPGPAGPRGPPGFLQNGLFNCDTLADVPVQATLGTNPVDNRGAYEAVDFASRGVFYTFIPDETGDYNINTCRQLPVDADSVIFVYELANPSESITAQDYTDVCNALGEPIEFDDDGCENAGALESTVNFAATAGNVYIIAIAGFADDSVFRGTFTISLVGSPRTVQKPKPKPPTKEEKQRLRQAKQANKVNKPKV